MYVPKSIFPTFSLDRSVIKWEDYLYTLTPVENHGGIWFKMDNEFAPLGPNGINGSKGRQCVQLINSQRKGKSHILTGSSVHSPQLSFSSVIGAHYGLKTRIVVGATKPETLLRHSNARVAYGMEAHFEYIKVAYNPALQREVKRLQRDDSLVVEYGITMSKENYNVAQVTAFHDVGAHQTQNIPDDVDLLIVPFGSGNSLCSILLGLSRDPKNIETVFTVGIGPDKTEWVKDRLRYMGVEPDNFPFKWKNYSLHATNYAKYSDAFNGEEFEGIKFHFRYEAKVWRWLRESADIPRDGTACFWIIGGIPDVKALEPYFTKENYGL